jgi:hypothetical protein
MKPFSRFFRWIGLYLLVFAVIAAGFWQESLPVPSMDHSIFLIVLLVILGFLIDRWVNRHPENFLAAPKYMNEVQKHEFGPDEKKTGRMEK